MAKTPALGVCYYPEHWPEAEWPTHAQQMREIGISYVRIGEFAWSRLEPNPGEFTFDWLDRSLTILHAAGLKVVLGTPTATPPKWLVDKMPDMLAVDENGQPRGFGSRRHYDFSHEGYRAECARITRKLAEAFGNHPAIVAWQTDNEYGCHDTVLSYSAGSPNSAGGVGAALKGFRNWLQDRYGSIEALNETWGNVFWSMEYRDFDEIELPNLTVTESNPAHRQAFRRYSSDQVVTFNKVQADILRELSPGRDIIHNFMGMFTEFDHYDVGADLDVSSWDSYPLGFLERRWDVSDEHKAAYLQQGNPDFQAFHHDLYRATSKGRWWVMEQQPGPVNWAPYNPAPLPGMIRLWSWEAFAHGAEVVSYFRFRQAPFAQEQMHAGLHLPDGTADIAAKEAAQVLAEIAESGVEVDTSQAEVALVFDYDSVWMTEIQPQGADYHPLSIVFQFYAAARKLGLSLDIVPPGADLTGYKLVLVPNLLHVSAAAAQAFTDYQGDMIFGPRTGSKTIDYAIPDTLPPGPLQHLLPFRVTRVESLRPGVSRKAGEFSISKWHEHLDLLREEDEAYETRGGYACLRFDREDTNGSAQYFAGWPDDALLGEVLHTASKANGIQTMGLPDGVRIRRLGEHIVVVNYAAEACPLPSRLHEMQSVLGEGDMIEAAGVRIFKG